MIRSDAIRDILLSKLVLPSDVFAMIDSDAVSVMAEGVKRVGILSPPTFWVQPDGSLNLLTGRKRMACALRLRWPSVRVRVIDCDAVDAELIAQTEKSYHALDSIARGAAQERMNTLMSVVAPAPPPAMPVKRVTPQRAAREMLAATLGMTQRSISQQQNRLARTAAENATMLAHPEQKPYIMALREARSLRYHLGAVRSQARGAGMGPIADAADAAISLLNQAWWPTGPCCMNSACPTCDGRGWTAGQRNVRLGRPRKPKPPDPAPADDDAPFDWNGGWP